MATTTWSLWVRGRIRTTIELADGGEDALAVLVPRNPGFRRPRELRATARDGREWMVTMRAAAIEVRCGDVVHVRVDVDGDDAVLHAGGRRFGWKAPWDWSRRVEVRDADGVRVLDAAAGEGRDAPWSVIGFSDALPSPFAVALAACFVLLHADAVGRDFGSGGSGP